MDLPPRVHVVVLVADLHRPTLAAVDCAKAMRVADVRGLHVQQDESATSALFAEWSTRCPDVPLSVVGNGGDLVETAVGEVSALLRHDPRGVVDVLIPQFVAGAWWEWPLHHWTARRLRLRLRLLDRVMVTTIPWQLQRTAQVMDAGRPSRLTRRVGS